MRSLSEDLRLFRKLSALLTGVDILSDVQVAGYFDRLMNADGYKTELTNLLLLVEEVATLDQLRKVLSESQLLCARGIVFLWYTGEMIARDAVSTKDLPPQRTSGSEGDYYSGLLWKVIKAHPPGLSGGYFGYWKYEPEN